MNFLKKIKENLEKASLSKFLIFITPIIIVCISLIKIINSNIQSEKIIYPFVVIIIVTIISIFFMDDDSYVYEKFNLLEEEDNGYYKAYLEIMIDSLKVANIQMESVKILNDYKNKNLNPFLVKLEGVYIHLTRITPPEKYKEYHDDILFELESFLSNYKN